MGIRSSTDVQIKPEQTAHSAWGWSCCTCTCDNLQCLLSEIEFQTIFKYDLLNLIELRSVSSHLLLKHGSKNGSKSSCIVFYISCQIKNGIRRKQCIFKTITKYFEIINLINIQHFCTHIFVTLMLENISV